jgi:anthranilate synthase component 1
MVARLRRPVPPLSQAARAASARSNGQAATEGFSSRFGQEDYEEGVRKAKHYIHEGDIFQVVLSRCTSKRIQVHPLDLYRTLRQVNPSPYMFYLELPDGLRLVGSSPEVLVRVENGVVETRPLAGTRPRGATEAEDDALAAELLADPKERAEHVMLVDLARNDLGRVCKYGTVRTTSLMEVERYSHVMHIVSNVQGQLAHGKDAVDVLRACFPAGTLSGAPKVRAMQIIDELEPERRGPYGGAVGYLSFSGNLDTCITIRTVVIQGDRAYFQAGAGIVADSDPATEFQETNNKLGALARALEMAERNLNGGAA